MEKRKEEILAKKARLAELKRQRELRQQEFTSNRRSIGSPGDISNSPANKPENRQELDNLISSLVGEDKGPSTPDSPSQSGRSRPSSYQSNGKFEAEGSEATSASPAAKTTSQPQTLSFAPFTTIYEIASDTPQQKEVLTYSKGVQTSEPFQAQRSTAIEEDIDEDGIMMSPRSQRRRLSRLQREREEELRENIRKEIEEELRVIQDPNHAKGAPKDDPSNKQPNFFARTLTTEELDAVTSSNDFLDFVDRSTKVIERALDEEYDVLADYRHSSNVQEDDDEYGTSGRRGRRVKEVMQFYDERWSRKRMVSDIGFSPKFPELVLSSYTKNPTAPYDPDGLILVWNQHMQSRPEYTFHATSDILTAKFSPFHPNLVLGGSYSGQVLLWDTRNRSPYPVQKTPLTGSGHTHPVYSLNIVGTQNAHNIISTSTDGVLCSWSVDMLSHPQEYLELSAPTATQGITASATTSTTSGPMYPRTDDIAPTSVAFPPSDPTYALAATEEGTIHLLHRYDRAGARAGIDARVAYRGHAAPVTSLDFHRATGPVDLSDLVLSTGLDWTVKLWRVRTPPSASSALSSTAAQLSAIPPVLDFNREDAVYDAKWSPVRPGVFASVDGTGALEVWDLAADVEVPVARHIPSPRMEAGAPVPVRSLNRVAWEVHEGRKLGVGGLDGVVTVFEVGTALGGKDGGRGEEWSAVKKLVGRLESERGI